MNIRKFVGATSRDALRLVREALGPDAVVLSNRTLEDGTVEIVGVADSDLAKISPSAEEGAAKQAAAAKASANSNPTELEPNLSTNAANPYASGDVFSSVFGANPGADDESHADAKPEPAPKRRVPADEAPRTMAESNPWLIEHARRVAQQAATPAPGESHPDARLRDRQGSRHAGHR